MPSYDRHMTHSLPTPDHLRMNAVLFDLDGTLLDSFASHFQAYKEMFSRFDIRVTKKKFLQTYSPDWYQTYEAFELPRDRWKTADAYWLEAAARQTPALFPGVRRTLQTLGHSLRLGLVSSGSKRRVFNDLARNRILNLFEVVVTGDDIAMPKPHPEGLLKAVGGLNLRPNEALFVGDANADLEMSRAAGVSFVGVKSAFGGLRRGSCRVVKSIMEIPALVRRMEGV